LRVQPSCDDEKEPGGNSQDGRITLHGMPEAIVEEFPR